MGQECEWTDDWTNGRMDGVTDTHGKEVKEGHGQWGKSKHRGIEEVKDERRADL